jgi:hypothetical protein
MSKEKEAFIRPTGIIANLITELLNKLLMQYG